MNIQESLERVNKASQNAAEAVAKLTELVENQKKKQTATANYGANCVEIALPANEVACKSEVDYLRQRLEWIREDLSYFRDALYKHTEEGHLPKIIGASAMKKALKALGLDDDYKVEAKTIYANDGKAEKSLVEIYYK